MYTLDDTIKQQISLGADQTKGMKRYDVQIYDQYDWSWTTIFTGNYYNRGSRYYTFDITELCRSRKSNWHKSYGATFDTDTNVVGLYRIAVQTDGGTVVNGNTIQVAHVYKYPNRQNTNDYLLDPGYIFFDISSGTSKNDVSLLLQGTNRYRTPDSTNPYMILTPRYPNVDNAQDLDYDKTMNFGMTIEAGSGQQSVTLFAVVRGGDYADDSEWLGSYQLEYLHMDDLTHTYFGPYKFMSSRLMDGYEMDDLDVYMKWTNANNEVQYRKIAEIDGCKSRYYLLWQDRYGSYQSQPFDGKMEYSESLTTTEIQNYSNKRFKNSVQVQPKWKLSSGWLKENAFIYYESIYLSPVLKLYDTETGREYDVIVTDKSYTEKKFKNEKTLMNITLSLELSEKQNITY